MLLSDTSSFRIHHPHRDRSRKRRRRFVSIVVEGLRQATGCRFLGKDKKTEKLLEDHGVPAGTIGINRVALGEQILHVVAVPNRFWYCRKSSKNLQRARVAAESRGQRWLMLPQRAIEALSITKDFGPNEFFDLVLHRAMTKGLENDAGCRDGGHDPSGCYAMRLATGASCHR